MGLLLKLFGQKGKISFTATDTDGDVWTGKFEITTLNAKKEDVKKVIKEVMWVEKRIRIIDVKITGYYELG